MFNLGRYITSNNGLAERTRPRRVRRVEQSIPNNWAVPCSATRTVVVRDVPACHCLLGCCPEIFEYQRAARIVIDHHCEWNTSTGSLSCHISWGNGVQLHYAGYEFPITDRNAIVVSGPRIGGLIDIGLLTRYQLIERTPAEIRVRPSDPVDRPRMVRQEYDVYHYPIPDTISACLGMRILPFLELV